jgi:hypothetical protein
MQLSLTRKRGPGLDASDASPFVLEKQIHQNELWGWFASTGIGLIVLAVFWLLLSTQPTRIPSLARLVIVSLGAGGFYFGVRFLAYWSTWVRQSRSHQPSGGIRPGAHGELSRNGFLFVVSAPGIASIIVFGILLLWGLGRSPEFGLAVSVVAGVSVQDISVLVNLWPLDSGYWVRQTSRGLDVLKLVERV